MSDPAKTPFADSRSARLLALAVFVLCVAALAYLHREDLLPAPPPEETATNPQFLQCRDERAGHVEKMLTEGVIDQTRHDQFLERAIAYCAAQFPPRRP